MKRLVVCLLALALVLAYAGIAAAEDPEVFTSGEYEYVVLEDGTAEIAGFTGNGDFVIPSELDGYTVSSVGNHALDGYSGMNAIVFPETPIHIGNSAFANQSLTRINVPESVVSVGNNPFSSNTILSEITVSPDHPYLAVMDGSLVSLEDMRLVTYPVGLKADTYAIPDGIREIGGYAFAMSDKLTVITIPDSVTVIDDMAFVLCSKLTEIVIPDGVTVIGEGAFSYCFGLTRAVIPESVTSIGINAFTMCPGLTAVVVPGSYAEQYCQALEIRYTYPE